MLGEGGSVGCFRKSRHIGTIQRGTVVDGRIGVTGVTNYCHVRCGEEEFMTTTSSRHTSYEEQEATQNLKMKLT